MGTRISKEELVKSVKVSQELIRKKWLTDVYSFNKDCLRVEDGDKKVELGDFHKKMCKFVDKNPKKQKLVLVPRTHLKSTLITIGKTLQWICEDPTTRILIANATYQMAVTFLTVIKRHLKNNETLKEFFGELAEDPEKWSENMITLDTERSVGGEKEATVFCYGMGGNLVSQHFDKIILDDVVNEDTISTREQVEKTILFYKRCQPLLEKDGELIIIGTRWSEMDLYDWIMDKENGVISEFDVFKREAIKNPVWDEDKRKFTDGDVLWPEKYSLKDFTRIRRKMGPYEFSAQFQNNPFPPEDATFRREWFGYYDLSELKRHMDELNIYTLIDPAISLDKEADYTALVTVGIDRYKVIYILDIERGRYQVSELIEKIFEQNEKWHPKEIGIEDVAFQRALRYSLKQEQQKRKRWLPVTEVKPHARSKDQRIKGLQPLYADGKVLHGKHLVYNDYLEDELLRFPRGKHDDMIDALAYSLDLMTAPIQKVTRWKGAHKYLY